MALNPEQFKQQIKAAMSTAYEASKSSEADPSQIQDVFAASLVSAIDTYIKSMDITIGIGVIQTAGTAAAQSNAAPIQISNLPPNSIS